MESAYFLLLIINYQGKMGKGGLVEENNRRKRWMKGGGEGQRELTRQGFLHQGSLSWHLSHCGFVILIHCQPLATLKQVSLLSCHILHLNLQRKQTVIMMKIN